MLIARITERQSHNHYCSSVRTQLPLLQEYLTSFSDSVQAILIGRFLVNLRETRSTDEEFGSANLQTSVLSTLNFNGRSIVGNMGEPLGHEHDIWDIELQDIHVAPDTHDLPLRHEASDRTLVA